MEHVGDGTARRLHAQRPTSFYGMSMVIEPWLKPLSTAAIDPPLPCALPTEGFPYEFGPETER